MYQITISRNTFDYKYKCDDEESVLYLYRRLKENYEESGTLSERVTMEIKSDDGGYWGIENNKLIESDIETINIICERGLP